MCVCVGGGGGGGGVGGGGGDCIILSYCTATHKFINQLVHSCSVNSDRCDINCRGLLHWSTSLS